MANYFIEYESKKYRVVCNKADITVATKAQLINHGVIIPQEQDLVWEIYDDNLKFFYVITMNEIPDAGGLLRISFKSEKVQSEEMSVSVEIEQQVGGAPEPPVVEEPAPAARYGDFIPRNFSIDDCNFSKALKYQLQLKGSLSSSLQNHLVDCVYEQMVQYTYWPGANGYRIVARALLDKYPHLDSAMDMGNAVSFWKAKISTKTRNARKRKDINMPEVKNKKIAMASVRIANKERLTLQGADQSVGASTPVKAVKPDYASLVNYLPAPPPGEDKASTEFLRKELANMYNRKTHDILVVQEYMKRTYYYRRTIILGNGDTPAKTIKEVLELFPFLQEPDVVSCT